MSWNNDPKALQSAIETALSADSVAIDLRFRPMFGGIMAYADGSPFASLSNAGLALKLPPDEREILMNEFDAEPLRYDSNDPPSKSYTLVPESWYDQPTLLAPILKKSIDYCANLPTKKKKTQIGQ